MKALYRKYRPTKISDVIGQDQVTIPLENALKKGTFSHSYLFTGPRGCGKTSVARIFAHEVNKFKYEIEDNYTDIIEIDAASNTGVDNIRELREKASIAPSTGKYKVYIIDEVHMLSKSAFNALLKTLEEPPAHVIFIMATTDAYKVPITITSRAQVYNFQLASPDVMQRHLKSIVEKEKIKITDDALSVIVARGGGSFRDSISLLDQMSTLATDDQEITREMVERSLGLPEQSQTTHLLTAYEQGNTAEITDLLKSIINSGTKPEIVAENLISVIIEDPKPTLLPLLSKLPEVKTPFSEAKLLLAFLENTAVTPVATPIAPKITEKPPVLAQEKPAKAIPKKEPAPAPVPEAPVPETVPTRPTTFDWDSYLENVKNVNLAIASTLSKCTYKLDGTILKIITERKIHKTILNSANNQRVLQKFLPDGYTVEIGDATELTNSSAEFSKISDIMGGVTEVKTDGVPF
ncbi:DNA polymerase III subunit gamma/tau [Candidatus Saccharibacteria bacterium]|nr:DNA polymerase III subunit gamma/tau [Candidatus Saccharibacteria bacterium]MBQ9403313.1 DNA polymerase III subunit gamma/tau [Candidatus Saccharibacteria bacterium]